MLPVSSFKGILQSNPFDEHLLSSCRRQIQSQLPCGLEITFFCTYVCACVCVCVCVCVCELNCFSCVRLFVTPWTIACQTPLSMGFPRQECWSGLPFPPPGDLPPGIESEYLMSPALAGRFFTTSATWEISTYKQAKRSPNCYKEAI